MITLNITLALMHTAFKQMMEKIHQCFCERYLNIYCGYTCLTKDFCYQMYKHISHSLDSSHHVI